MQPSTLIDALIRTLEQEQELLDVLTDQTYTASGKGAYRSSIGMHIRHNLDHFAAFFIGLTDGRIDYESRQRNELLQESLSFAKGVIQSTINQLNELRTTDIKDVQVRQEDGQPLESCNWLPSTSSRELQFLLGHTVHHHAIIAMMLHAQELPLPEGFGVAPSTQRHEARTSN